MMLVCGEGREEEKGTAKEKVNGGDNGRNGPGPGGAERSGEESECVEDADHDGRKIQQIDGTRQLKSSL